MGIHKWPETGGCVVSRRVLSGEARLKWAFRETPGNPIDNGWRFLSAADDDEYLSDPANSTIATFDRVAEIEPAIAPFFARLPGTELEIVGPVGAVVVMDTATGAPATVD